MFTLVYIRSQSKVPFYVHDQAHYPTTSLLHHYFHLWNFVQVTSSTLTKSDRSKIRLGIGENASFSFNIKLSCQNKLHLIRAVQLVKYVQDPGSPVFMMTSSNWNIFRVTVHLCGEFTGHRYDRWIPHTKASDATLWCFLWSVPEWMVE